MHQTNLWSTKLFSSDWRFALYLHFLYMRFPCLRNALFRTCFFRTCVFQYLRFQRPCFGMQWHQVDHMQTVCSSWHPADSVKALMHYHIIGYKHAWKFLEKVVKSLWILKSQERVYCGYSTVCIYPTVLWCCWMGDGKGTWPVKTWGQIYKKSYDFYDYLMIIVCQSYDRLTTDV